jgi:hypothetical protein
MEYTFSTRRVPVEYPMEYTFSTRRVTRRVPHGVPAQNYPHSTRTELPPQYPIEYPIEYPWAAVLSEYPIGAGFSFALP